MPRLFLSDVFSRGALFLAAPAENRAASYGGGADFTRSLFLLIFVCIAVFVLTYYLTKYISRARITSKMHGNIYIAEVISVGVGANVMLIKAGKKYCLIGVTKDRITRLAQLDEEDVRLPEQGEESGANIFEKYLRKTLNKISGAAEADNPAADGHSYGDDDEKSD